jgi:transcriptional antiterminator NusG
VIALDPVKERDALELASIAWPTRPLRVPSVQLAPEWYVAHIIGVSDQHAVDWLRRQRLEAYYPQLLELKPISRKKLSKKQRALGVPIMRPVKIPLFPRYIFIRFDIRGIGWRDQLAIAGVAGIACNTDGLPYKVDDALIAGIRSRETKGGAVPGTTPLWELLSIGDRIRINAGPLEGHEGAIEAIKQLPAAKFDSAIRLRVAVALFGRATSVELEIDQVERPAA